MYYFVLIVLCCLVLAFVLFRINVTLVEVINKICQMSGAYSTEFDRKYNELNALRHDIKKEYMLGLMYINTGNIKRLEDHFRRIVDLDVLNGEDTGNPFMDMIINHIKSKSSEYNIKCYIDVKVPIDLCVDEFKINRLLCNISDNALEAAAACLDKSAFVRLVIRIQDNNMYIECSNTFCKESRIRSRRQLNGHGYGMLIIKEIAAYYNGLVECSEDGDIYSIKVLICNVEKRIDT